LSSCKYQAWVRYEEWEGNEIDGRREDEEVELIDELREMKEKNVNERVKIAIF
jgi:hypothetical protein